MADQKEPECLKIDPEKSIIVVSDLHLGAGEGDTASRDFVSFLEWLNQLCTNSKTFEMDIAPHEVKKTLHPPQMLILLGDIMDLWVQREPLRSALFSDAFPVFSKLRDLPIPIVYVIGNHDRELYEIKGVFPENIPAGKIIIEPDQFSNTNNTEYPVNPVGIKLGKYEYVFLHGQQFDESFKLTRSLSEFPGWVSNNSSVFEAHPEFRYLSWGVLVIGILYGVLLWLGLLSFIPAIVYPVILIILGISLPIAAISIPSGSLNTFYEFISKNSLGKKLTALYQRISHQHRGKRIDQLIAARIFKKETERRSGTNVVVFGHTHMPDIYVNDQYNKWFINTGSWDCRMPSDVKLDSGLRYHIYGKDEEMTPAGAAISRDYVWNSFVYIDKSGPWHFIWDTDDPNKAVARYLKIDNRKGFLAYLVPNRKSLLVGP